MYTCVIHSTAGSEIYQPAPPNHQKCGVVVVNHYEPVTLSVFLVVTVFLFLNNFWIGIAWVLGWISLAWMWGVGLIPDMRRLM